MRTLQYTRMFVVCLLSAGVVYFSLATIEAVYATTYYAKVTGYAFASTSASGMTLQQNHFANHPPQTMCGNPPIRDWSGDWPWGTQITMANPVTQRTVSNVAYTRRVFYLYDNGDPYCTQGINWADLYFGRYKQNPTSNCTCPGVSPNSCIAGNNNVNNCTDAVNFGSATRYYSQP